MSYVKFEVTLNRLPLMTEDQVQRIQERLRLFASALHPDFDMQSDVEVTIAESAGVTP